MVDKEMTLGLPDGLNSSAGAFVMMANRFKSQLLIEFGNKKINAKSTLGVLSLRMKQGDVFHIIASGEDADEAVLALEQMLTGK